MNYFGWVLLLELVCFASPLRADDTGTVFSLLPARNHKHPFPFFRVWTVRKEHGRCSPQVSNRVTEGSRPRKQHQGIESSNQNKGHDEQHTGISSGFKKYFWADIAKRRESEARQEHSTRATFLKFIQSQFKDCIGPVFHYMKVSHFLSEAGRVISSNSTKQ